ncbi:DUF1648 domain-containing protein [Streptomyces hydrogenans]|uniref:DUF1648 domain-containing protein n=1 Tax=Streptomyces hydrogenans TaxID=1873719 RepID=A0ABQ3PFX1_9ACTN|nr:DUF1648 domain-containing protein [Streptomyces hydrogenans]GHG23285.1 hypothetical protein GCM10018784_40830 [Streptomyces hydrogenans]GHI23918.1 hypothetical protein Shyd_52890 [Streptomyces hydrogenans]
MTTAPHTAALRVPFRLRALAALPFALAAVTYVALLAVWSDRLPDPLATHFSYGGEADGFTGRAAFTAVGAALLLTLGAGWTVLVRRGALWGAWLTAGLTGTLLVLVVHDNLDAADPADVVSPLSHLAVAAAAGAALALAGHALSRLVPPEEHEGAGPAVHPDAPRLDLGAGELAGWSRATASAPLTALGLLFLAGGAVAVLLGPWPLLLIALAVAVPGLALARIRVSVDRHGLTVRSTLTPRPRVHVPLDDITAADVRPVDALREFGGWGYRVRAHRSGVVLRSGEALVVRRGNGREFAVTVPDARTAAALLNTLVERRGRL